MVGWNVRGGGMAQGETHTPKYLDQFLMVLLETFTTELVFLDNQKKGQQPYVL